METISMSEGKNMNTKRVGGIMAAEALVLMATPVVAADKAAAKLDAAAEAVIKRDFRDKGIAKVDRLNQDDVQAACTKYLDNPPDKLKMRLQAEQEKAIKWPADGK